MDVRDAVPARRSTRAFLPTPVDDSLIADLLERAARAPSGGNLQPWRVFVVNGDAMPRLQHHLADIDIEAPEYDIYPADLHEPYRTSRFEVGEQMYALLGIDRDDKAGRWARFAENHAFFGAPCGLFCFLDRRMGPPQWSDLGMFLQTFMLLATEAGLDTCAQESWATRARTIAEFVEAPEDLMLFCGMAIGQADPDAPVNTLVSDRRPLDEWARFVSQ